MIRTLNVRPTLLLYNTVFLKVGAKLHKSSLDLLSYFTDASYPSVLVPLDFPLPEPMETLISFFDS